MNCTQLIGIGQLAAIVSTLWMAWLVYSRAMDERAILWSLRVLSPQDPITVDEVGRRILVLSGWRCSAVRLRAVLLRLTAVGMVERATIADGALYVLRGWWRP